ncbi:Z1 domain-containing protein [Bradyrhizobium sp. TM239]|uniref:Z1 domain-containing protein n=1 Tax=Bradyrhizobium sp. TM239 TaxID=2599802 RepID=UPI0027D56CE4|nr:Z1 domain-containing protein [Bradyrhizobium sp. TM239]
MLENLKNLELAVEGLLAREPSPTPEKIRELITSFRVIPTCAVSDADAERLARQLEARHDVTMTIGAMLTSHDFEPWLEGRRSSIDPYYWGRYKRLLAEKNYSSQVLATMDNVTDRILGLLENPDREGHWDRRGMVVGHVQSGKTANYIGLICKAADVGYRIIIVIAGIHNNLRNQTQVRIDEGFVGRDSALKVTDRERRIIGVGRYDSRHLPWTFTNSVRDFNRVGAEQVGGKLSDLRVPAVFVIKKNSKTLKNLTDWLKEYNARGGGRTVEAPMLLIDDEADNASINIKHGQGEVSKINAQIRELLRMFERSCYVGYTATPFANIFISPDTDDAMLGEDLFPKHFIVGLDPPTNYFGATRVFVDEPRAFIRHIDDNGDYLPLTHPKETQVATLPPSLIKAVRTFVVARAIRLVRGQANQHCSMLVNASRFTDVQRQIRNEIHVKLEAIQASCRVNGALSPEKALKDPEIRELHAVWDEEYSDTDTAWPDIQKALHEAASTIRAVEVNSRSSGALNYADHEKTGLNVIAVGGFSLSRGLTLEGLMVSYFLRNSMMYDTLMQMGRWFGYRPGYEDLCRVWMLDTAESWYRYIAEAVEELREEMRRMEEANATPEQFGLKVRSHPDTLIVTARNKMGSGEQVVVRVGLGNEFIETTALKWDDSSLKANRRAAVNLAEHLSAEGRPFASSDVVSGGRLLQAVPVGPILEFLTEFQNDQQSMLTDPAPVRRYIEDRARGELKDWDIFVPSVSRPDYKPLIDHSLGIEVTCQRRKQGSTSRAGRTLLVTDNQRVASRGVEKIGVDPDAAKDAEIEFRQKHSEEEVRNFPDRIYRNKRVRPLLILHLLAIGEAGDDLSGQDPIVAWSISFPKTDLEEDRVEYVVNTTWMRENYRDDIDEDEMAGDDE